MQERLRLIPCPNLVTESQNHVISEEKVTFDVLFCEEHCCVLMDIVVKDLKRKHEKDLINYLATEMRYCLQTFMFFKLFLPLDRSSTCF